jgi:uncharacterized protein YndB with AHSA1/START domain
VDGIEQGESSAVIDTGPATIWPVLCDSSLLSEWVPAVTGVLEHAPREQPGASRRCSVLLGGREGFMVERCVEAVAERRLRYVVDDDSFGFGRMLDDYSFTLELTPDGASRTTVTLRTFYAPRGRFARVLNALVLKRRFARVREEILAGLSRFMEENRSG